MNPRNSVHGAQVVQWPIGDTDNLKWLLVPAGEEGLYFLIAKHSGQALAVHGGSLEYGAQFVQWPIGATSALEHLKWRIVNPSVHMMGMVAIKSVHGRYLQAYTDGEMQASNSDRHTEETWFLIQVDEAKHAYALLNWHNRRYVRKEPGGECAPANSTKISAYERWTLIAGERYGVAGAVAMKSEPDGTFLGANSPGHDRDCGGEVDAHWTGPPRNDRRWGGWWFMQPTDTPEPGRTWDDFWNFMSVVSAGVSVVTSFIGDGNRPANLDEVAKA